MLVTIVAKIEPYQPVGLKTSYLSDMSNQQSRLVLELVE
jgi:hypothetical protein